MLPIFSGRLVKTQHSKRSRWFSGAHVGDRTSFLFLLLTSSDLKTLLLSTALGPPN